MTTITHAGGLAWYTDTASNDDIGPEHEATIQQLVLDLLPAEPPGGWKFPDPRGTFLDIGAHVGHYTVRAARLGYRVVAVEANPDTAGRLLANVVLNNLDGHVRVIPHPAWDILESVEWIPVNPEFTRNASGQVHPDPTGRLWPVVLDDVLGTEPRIDVVKIDTEGAELHVLRGLRATLKRCRPVLWIEDHVFTGAYTPGELAALLDELRYDQADGGDWSGLHYWLCRPRDGGR